jgi:hypothetical protein
VGEIWSGEQGIIIEDSLDRSHKYVQWGPHKVYFNNKGTNNEWWSHTRKSRIHRTALSARCKMLRANSLKFWPDYFKYSDKLPFTWEDLDQNRKELCEYCFFGGPDKHKPFPQEDWF